MQKKFCKYCNNYRDIGLFHGSNNKCHHCVEGKQNNSFILSQSTSKERTIPNQALVNKRRARAKLLDDCQIEDDFSL